MKRGPYSIWLFVLVLLIAMGMRSPAAFRPPPEVDNQPDDIKLKYRARKRPSICRKKSPSEKNSYEERLAFQQSINKGMAATYEERLASMTGPEAPETPPPPRDEDSFHKSVFITAGVFVFLFAGFHFFTRKYRHQPSADLVSLPV